MTLAGLAAGWHATALLRRGEAPFPARPAAAAPHPATAVAAAAWLAFSFAASATADGEGREDIDTETVAVAGLINLMIAGLIAALLFATRTRPDDAKGSAEPQPWAETLRDAGLMLALIFPPTIALMLAADGFRGPETEHALLKLLGNNLSIETILAVGFTAVVAAPVLEELLFRVIVQPTLGRVLPVGPAVAVTAVLFAISHGWRDAVPLLPIAVGLGWLYARRGVIASVMLVHAGFNALFVLTAILQTRAGGD